MPVNTLERARRINQTLPPPASETNPSVHQTDSNALAAFHKVRSSPYKKFDLPYETTLLSRPPAFRRRNALTRSQSCQLEIHFSPLQQIRKPRQIQADGKLSIQRLQ
jgi:hypothetical protein